MAKQSLQSHESHRFQLVKSAGKHVVLGPCFMVNALFFWEQIKKQQTNKKHKPFIGANKKPQLPDNEHQEDIQKTFKNVSWKCSSLWFSMFIKTLMLLYNLLVFYLFYFKHKRPKTQRNRRKKPSASSIYFLYPHNLTYHVDQLSLTKTYSFNRKKACTERHSCSLQTAWKTLPVNTMQYITDNYEPSVQIIISLTNVHKHLQSILYFH